MQQLPGQKAPKQNDNEIEEDPQLLIRQGTRNPNQDNQR